MSATTVGSPAHEMEISMPDHHLKLNEEEKLAIEDQRRKFFILLETHFKPHTLKGLFPLMAESAPHTAILRQLCDRLFSCPQEAQADYELFLNQKCTTQKSEERKSIPHTPYPLRSPEADVSSMAVEWVEDIEQDHRLFQVPELDRPAPLSLAVSSQFLTTAKGYKWWEALNELDLSKRGSHIICSEPSDTIGEAPRLISSALIQNFENYKQSGGKLLMLDPFFSQEGWNPEFGRNEFMDACRQAGLTESLNIDFSKIPEKPTSTNELEVGLIEAVGRSAVVEIDRLSQASDADKKMERIYHMIASMFDVLAEQGKPLSLAITYENPFVNIFEAVEQAAGKKCLMGISRKAIKEGEGMTRKIAIFNRNLADSMREVGHNQAQRLATRNIIKRKRML